MPYPKIVNKQVFVKIIHILRQTRRREICEIREVCEICESISSEFLLSSSKYDKFLE